MNLRDECVNIGKDTLKDWGLQGRAKASQPWLLQHLSRCPVD